MSRVQGRDSDVSNLLSNNKLNERCEVCRNVSSCNVCGSSISGFEHIGVRAVAGRESGIWHYASPCRHRNQLLNVSQCEVWWRPTLEERLHLAEHLLGSVLHKLFRLGLGCERREGNRRY